MDVCWTPCDSPYLRVKTSLGWLELAEATSWWDEHPVPTRYRWQHASVSLYDFKIAPDNNGRGYTTPEAALKALLAIDGFPHIDAPADIRKKCKEQGKEYTARLRRAEIGAVRHAIYVTT